MLGYPGVATPAEAALAQGATASAAATRSLVVHSRTAARVSAAAGALAGQAFKTRAWGAVGTAATVIMRMAAMGDTATAEVGDTVAAGVMAGDRAGVGVAAGD